MRSARSRSIEKPRSKAKRGVQAPLVMVVMGAGMVREGCRGRSGTGSPCGPASAGTPMPRWTLHWVKQELSHASCRRRDSCCCRAGCASGSLQEQGHGGELGEGEGGDD